MNNINAVFQQQEQQQHQYNSQQNEIDNAEFEQDKFIATFSNAIEQLQKAIENPSQNARLSSSQSTEQVQVLLEKYEKIEQMVISEQQQIQNLISTHNSLQHELQASYSSHQKTISQGKYDILHLSLVNKQALSYQNKGQQTLQKKQQEAEILVQNILKIQNEIQETNSIIQNKSLLEKSVDEQNARYQQTIDEFRKDQEEQKEGLEEYKQNIQNGEKEIKLVKKEQIDMQRKLDNIKFIAQEVKSKSSVFINAREVAFSELKNEKRTLQISERKLEEIQQGLQSVEGEIVKNNDQLQRIRQVNETFKRKLKVAGSEELQTLESILQQYNDMCIEKQKIIETKQQEKQLLEEHLSQLHIFAQQYLEKQSQEEEDESTNTHPHHVQQQEEDEENHNLTNLHEANNYGMECIQSQYDQEQDSQTSPHLNSFNIKSTHQSKQSGSSSVANYQLFNDQKPQQESSQEKKEEQERIQERYDDHDNEEIEGQQIYRKAHYNQNGFPVEIDSAIQMNIQNVQGHFGTPSDSEKLNVEKYTPEGDQLENREDDLHKQYESAESFGNIPHKSLNESPVESRNPYDMDSNLDPNHKRIVNQMNQGGFKGNQDQIGTYVLRREEQQQSQQKGQKQNGANEQQNAMIKMSLQGNGYNQIFNQIKNSMANSEQQQQQQVSSSFN